MRYLYLSYLSKPKSDRALYRAIAGHKPRKILEIGLGTGDRALRMIDLATRVASDPVRFVAIDLFEARPADGGASLTLKDAYRLLKSTTAQVQLIPGDAASALQRSANALQNIDLVVISLTPTQPALGSGWFYLPRMLHSQSAVYLETTAASGEGVALALLPAAEIETRAAASRSRRAA